jgi:hypothetical protein
MKQQNISIWRSVAIIGVLALSVMAAETKPALKHWSLQPVAPPTGATIDTLIEAKLREAGLTMSAEADRRTLIRRLMLDVEGLPPTPEEIKAFIDDRRSDAYERLVERVLASPHYGERWAQHWLDTVRFAETSGYETNVERPTAWLYRDYVIRSLNEDKPYDRFVFEQIAGDSVGVDEATGFLVGGSNDRVKSPDPVLTAQQRQDELADMVSTTGSALLGLTLGCARCHDHKFDPITSTDYYAVQAVFAGVMHGERPLRSAADPSAGSRAAELQKQIGVLSRQFTALEPLAFTGRTVLLDESQTIGEDGRGVKHLFKPSGNPPDLAGDGEGYRDFTGSVRQMPNLSGGRYLYWRDRPRSDLAVYRPVMSGRVHVWVSWGVNASHTHMASYVLDVDGDLSTTADQKVIAKVNQTTLADGSKPGKLSGGLWSGLSDAGVHEMTERSVIVLRSAADDNRPITADVLVFQQATEQAVSLPRMRPAVTSKVNVEKFAETEAKRVRFTIDETNNGIEPCIDELEIFEAPTGENVALASAGAKATSGGDYRPTPRHRLEHINDGQYGNEHSWIAKTNGKGLVEIELAKPTRINRVVWGRDRNERYNDRTPTVYRVEVAGSDGAWRVVAGSMDRLPHGLVKAANVVIPAAGLTEAEAQQAEQLAKRLDELTAERKKLLTKPLVYAGIFQQPEPTHRLYRGDAMSPKEVVAPGAIAALGSLGLKVDEPEQQRRIALAKWITSPTNPLTARVIVNRIWQHHFGTGIVDTPSDFGANGGKPSHPQLLDYLAGELVDHGWSLKHVHRLILLSKAYRQSSKPSAESLAVDAQNRLLWRFPPRRLDAEPIRDSILRVSGVLDERVGGEPFSVFEPNSNYVRVYEPKETMGPAEWRRAIYMRKVRMQHDGVFGAFDTPDGGQVCPKRSRSTTAIQALNLFNSAFIVQQSDLLAARVKREVGGDERRQLERLFELALGRPPEAEEGSAAMTLVKAHGLAALGRAVLNANEFLFLP